MLPYRLNYRSRLTVRITAFAKYSGGNIGACDLMLYSFFILLASSDIMKECGCIYDVFRNAKTFLFVHDHSDPCNIEEMIHVMPAEYPVCFKLFYVC